MSVTSPRPVCCACRAAVCLSLLLPGCGAGVYLSLSRSSRSLRALAQTRCQPCFSRFLTLAANVCDECLLIITLVSTPGVDPQRPPTQKLPRTSYTYNGVDYKGIKFGGAERMVWVVLADEASEHAETGLVAMLTSYGVDVRFRDLS